MRTSIVLRIALGLLPLTAAVAGCATGADLGDGTSTTTGEVRPGETLDPNINQLGRADLTGAEQAGAVPYRFDCSGESTCSIAVGVQFEPQTLVNADLSGLDGIVDVIIIDSAKGKIYVKAPLGMTNGRVTSTYVSANLPPANYSVFLSLRSGLPQPDLTIVPIQYCIGGGRNAPRCDTVASSSAPSTRVSLSGRIVHGSFNPEAAPDVAIELVRKNGSSIAARFAMSTDAAGYWTATDVLPDNYMLKVGSTLYPVTVTAFDKQQTVKDLAL